MSKREDSIAALLSRSEETLQKIEGAYNRCLQSKTISTDLKVDIKNFCENMRSVLDYLAHDIRETHCPAAKPNKRFYFPILPSRAEFEAQVEEWYPGLASNWPELWKYLESVQPYNSDYLWLGTFNRLNSENKHDDLVEQTRTETREIRVSIVGGGQVSWNPDSVRFGNGVYIGGVQVDPKTQMPIPHPTQKVERIIWVDFQFRGIGVSALQLLKQSFSGIKSISTEIYNRL